MNERDKIAEIIRNARMFADPLSQVGYAEADAILAHGVTVQEWVSVKNRLPVEDNPVCICTNKGFVYAGVLLGDTWFLDNDSWTETVTHWMPLPEPPKGD